MKPVLIKCNNCTASYDGDYYDTCPSCGKDVVCNLARTVTTEKETLLTDYRIVEETLPNMNSISAKRVLLNAMLLLIEDIEYYNRKGK